MTARLAELATALEAGVPDKAARLVPLVPNTSTTILDLGSGTGGVTRHVARHRPEARVIGVDRSRAMVRIARTAAGAIPNVSFREDDVLVMEPMPADAVILSSVLHEVYSYGGGLGAVRRCLALAAACVAAGGTVIIRDFLRPDTPDRDVELRDGSPAGRVITDLASRFGWPARAHLVGAFRQERRYTCDIATVYEFMFRSEYRATWEPELEQRYGFWCLADVHGLLESAGLVPEGIDVRSNRWVRRNRLDGRFRLTDPETGALLAPPVDQVVITAKPAGRG